MRKSFDGLCGLIRSELDADPLSGDMSASYGQIDRCQLSMLLEGITPKKVSKR
jgi:hypothetical protein